MLVIALVFAGNVYAEDVITTEPLVCTDPQVLNETNDACIDVAPIIVPDTTAPTIVSSSINGNTIVYTFSEETQLVNQATLEVTPFTKDLIAIYAIDSSFNYGLDTKADVTIDSAIVSGNTLTVTFTGKLVAGTYLMDTWGYNITDLAGNKIGKDANAVFTAVEPVVIVPVEPVVPPTPVITPVVSSQSSGGSYVGPQSFSTTTKVIYVWDVVKLGDKGENVKILQKVLNANGAKLIVDGSYGPKTLKAFLSFKK